MARPTFLIAEPEPKQALSVRKLVLETAKFNVITAHTGGETLELFKKFPDVDCVTLHSQMTDPPCEEVLKEIRKIRPHMRVIYLSAGMSGLCKGADHTVSSHDPDELLSVVRELYGDPRQEE